MIKTPETVAAASGMLIKGLTRPINKNKFSKIGILPCFSKFLV